MNLTASVPVVDVSGLRSNERSDVERIAHEIGVAAREIGFFSIVNHGVPQPLIAAMFTRAREFFAQPLETKERVSMDKSTFYRGYVRDRDERLDPSLPGDAKESFNVGPDYTESDPEVVAGEQGCNLWPDVPGFRRDLNDYAAACGREAMALHRAFAIDLGVDEAFFAEYYDRPQNVLRLLRYPPHPGAFDGSLHGAAPHTDYGIVTLLAQEDVGGLEVRRRDGTWIPVEPVAGSFVCNIGDCLMRWSNDLYVSTPHRVVNRSGRERYSVAFFGDPSFDTLVSCLPTCQSAENPPRYAPITYRDHLRYKYTTTYVAN